MANDTKTLQGKSVMPSLTVNDLKASEAFFTGLGFEIEDRWEQDGKRSEERRVGKECCR